MIEINLIPETERRKKKKGVFPGGVRIPLEVVIGCGGGLIILLVCIHILLLGLNIFKISQHKSFTGKLAEIADDKQRVEEVIADFRQLQSTYTAIEKISDDMTRYWSRKFNIISNELPSGVWLDRLSFSEDKFFIQGSAMSRQSNEMVNVHSFMSSLKSNDHFLEYFDNLEIGSIQRRKIRQVEVVDFIITVGIEESENQQEE